MVAIPMESLAFSHSHIMEGLFIHVLPKDVMMGISGAVQPPTLTRIRATPFVQSKMVNLFEEKISWGEIRCRF